jgi:catechol 2,3-dioxygenase-like lactoylglutathione lyase family enzyme
MPSPNGNRPLSPTSLDHVALWVADRAPLAAFLCDHLGMHEIERTEKFTLVGADARQGKLTLFEAEGPRDPGVLERVVLRVGDLDAALASLPGSLQITNPTPDIACFEAPEGLGVGLMHGDDTVDYDIDHVVLRVPDPSQTAQGLLGLGFARDGDRLLVGDRHVRLDPGGRPEGERPLLNHLALLVDSADEVESEARRRGLEIDDVVDAPNTLAVFVWGPDRIRVEYVEHKPGFALV